MAALRARAGVKYDEIGRTYAHTRATDPRIAAAIWEALGDARTVVNVGAGTGNYEPPDRDVTAVEPSAVMIAQRPPGRRAGACRRAPRRCRSRTTASTPRWPCSRSTTGATGAAGSTSCGASPGGSCCSRGTRASRGGRGSSRLLPVRRRRGDDVPVARRPGRRAARHAGDRRPGPARLPGRLLQRVLAPPGRLPRPRGPRRDLGAGRAHARGDSRPASSGCGRTSQSGAWAEQHADLLEREELDLGYRLLVA